MRSAGQAVDQFGNTVNRASQASEGHKLSLGRVERALSSYVGHAIGANAVTEQLSVAFGAFATGGEVMAGVLLGLGALAAAYELITADSRKAKEESDKLTKSLVDQAAAQFQATQAGATAIAQAAEQNLANIKAESTFGVKSALLSVVTGKPTLDTGDAVAQANRLADAESAVTQAWANVGKIALDTAASTRVATSATKELTFGYNELRNAAAKVNLAATDEGKQFWRDYIDSQNAALGLWDQLENKVRAAGPSLLDAFQAITQIGQTVPKFEMPNIPKPFEGLTDAQKDTLKTLGVMKDDANKNSETLKGAIENSALQIGNIVVNALNIGGGGKGSNLGGAIGSTAGSALGYWGMGIGSIGGPIGSMVGGLVGTIAGSLIGGLFDHKKAVDTNTAAVRANTAALIQFAPAGFKVEQYRYAASDPAKQVMNDFAIYKTRGGTVNLGL